MPAPAIRAPVHAATDLIDLVCGPTHRIVAFDGARPITVSAFLAHIHGVAAQLPDGSHLLNLCEHRYRFLVTLCAGLIRGVPTLLPPSRAPGVLLEMMERFPDSFCVGNAVDMGGTNFERVPPRYHGLPETLPEREGSVPRIAAGSLAAIGFTSGSSGPPKPQPKLWGSFCASNALNAALLDNLIGPSASLVATVPPQHMYGMETSVLLPLRGGVAIHTARPFFPGDIAAALQQLPAPRVLVTTPVHLRALVASGQRLPDLAAILSATAPLGVDLALAAEAATGAKVLELFGSTETCVLGHRRTAKESDWTHYPSVTFSSRPDGALVEAPWLPEPVLLQDVIETLPEQRFRLAGRASDHLEIAGKRASLGELTRRLLAIDGVRDGVMFQLDASVPGAVQRIAALAVAPGMDEATLLAALREAVDPVFLPRPLRLLAALPRNDTGKLPRQALLDALRAATPTELPPGQSAAGPTDRANFSIPDQ